MGEIPVTVTAGEPVRSSGWCTKSSADGSFATSIRAPPTRTSSSSTSSSSEGRRRQGALRVPPPSATPQTTSGAPATGTPASHPGDEFKNLKTIGVVVDDLTAQATSCGLTQSAIETAVVRRFTDAGFTVHRYQDQSPYVFVEVATSSVGNGLCVSRYDVTLTTHAMTTLSYQQTPVLAEITLLRDGGLTGGNPGVHAENVTHGLVQYVDQFIARIRDANK